MLHRVVGATARDIDDAEVTRETCGVWSNALERVAPRSLRGAVCLDAEVEARKLSGRQRV